MNQVDTALLPKHSEQDERFRYGWRDVRRRLPDGSYQHLQLPLTLYDVLHPQECDKIMNNSRHDTELEYFAVVLKDHFRHDPSVLVLRDVGVYWDTPGLGHHSPDISVIFNIDDPRPLWSSFHVAQEGVRSRLLIEVVSPSTREADTVTKLEEYHRAEVPWYVIIDRAHEDDPPTLLVHRWMSDRYALVEPDAQGLFLLEPIDLKLGLIEDRIALFDTETGQELGDYSAIKSALEAEIAARQAAEERANAEAAARKAAEERANAEATARQAADARASEAERRAAELQQRLHDLEENLRHRNGLNGPPQKP